MAPGVARSTVQLSPGGNAEPGRSGRTKCVSVRSSAGFPSRRSPPLSEDPLPPPVAGRQQVAVARRRRATLPYDTVGSTGVGYRRPWCNATRAPPSPPLPLPPPPCTVEVRVTSPFQPAASPDRPARI